MPEEFHQGKWCGWAVFWLRSEFSKREECTNRDDSQKIEKKKTNERSHPPPMIHPVQSNHPLCLRVKEGCGGEHMKTAGLKCLMPSGLFMNYGFEFFAENNSVIRCTDPGTSEIENSLLRRVQMTSMTKLFHANKRQFH